MRLLFPRAYCFPAFSLHNKYGPLLPHLNAKAILGDHQSFVMFKAPVYLKLTWNKFGVSVIIQLDKAMELCNDTCMYSYPKILGELNNRPLMDRGLPFCQNGIIGPLRSTTIVLINIF